MGKSETTRQRSYKAALATSLAIGTLVATAPVNVDAAQIQFKDVKEGQFFYESVQDLASRGVISGYKDGTFRPGESISRGQAAKIISLALGLDTKNVKDPGFKDVSKNSPYYGYVAALVEAKIISGYDNQTFKPTEKLTRAHISKILVNGFELEEVDASNLPFKDVNKKSWSASYIQTLFTNEITKGKTATTFEPNANVTRGEAAALIHRTENSAKLKPVEIKDVTSAGITLTDGTYTLSANLKDLFSAENVEALKGAKIRYTVQGKEIVNVSYLEINANGTETKNIVLDGKASTFEGSLNVIGHYVEVKNLTVKGVATVSTKTPPNIVKPANVVGTPVTTTTFSDVQLKDLQVSKAGSIVELKGKTNVESAYILADNVLLRADKDITLTEVSVQATNVSVDANVKKLNVLLKDSKITITANSKIENFVLPAGVNAKDVIENYEAVKGLIQNINGKANPDAAPPVNPHPNPNPDVPAEKFQLSLMHFNDTHAHLDNAAKRVTAVNEVRATKPNALLLDAGDVFSGTLYFNQWQGMADLEFMNLMKVDAMTFGNHEFDLGSSEEGHKALADFIKAANFPFVSANVDFSQDDLFTGLFSTKIPVDPNKVNPKDENIYSGIVKIVNGQKVGIFGLTTAETKDISSPGSITFSDYIEDAKTMVAEFEKQGVNKIVALTHIGFDDNPNVDNDQELAKAVEGIDVIVGGHSHTTLAKPVVVDAGATPTVIVQTGQYAENLGTLDVDFDKNGKVIGHDGKLIKVADKAEDPAAKEILKKYKDKIEEISAEETGAIAVKALENPRASGDNLYSVRSNETPLGNLITDGMLNKAKKYNDEVVMAFQNGGGIREAINQGPITVGEIISVLPFGNTLATMDLTGAEIKEAFEVSFKSSPKESGGFLHVSGAEVKYDSTKSVGERVVSVAYKNADGTFTEVEDSETYTIATNAFTAKGGDGYDVLKRAYEQGRVTDLGLSDWENLREHVVSLGNVDPKVEGRIVDVSVEEEQPESNILSLMHFNDTHAHLDNAAKRVTAVNEVRAAKPDALLLDAGDVFSGTLYFNQWQGMADLEFMNLMKVDAMTFGNHEFDLGASDEGHKALADFIKAANFPFVSANVDFSQDELFTGLFSTKIPVNPKKVNPEDENIYSGIVKEVNGEKVGIFGLTTAETKDISSPKSITFSDYIEDAKTMVAEFEKLGVNRIVALTHIGYDDNPAVDNDIELAKAVEGIDVIVGGHSHTTLAEPKLIDAGATPTVIVQTGQYAENLGTLDVEFDENGKVVGHVGKLIKVADKAEDPEAKEILKKYKDKIEEISAEETGAIAVKALENPRAAGDNLYSVRSNETPLGNLITDGMLNKAKKYNDKVVMAFQNGGGIREAINQGPITVGEIISVLPFGNTLATMDLTGAEIKEAFEISFKSSPKESGGFLHVSGAQVKYDSSKPVGARVVSVAYKNANGTFTEVQDDETYTIATNAFTAKGGDGYDVLKRAYEQGRVTDLGLSDWENLREHVVSLGNVDPKVEGRIVDVAGGEGELPGGDVPSADFSGTTDNPKVYNGDVTVSVSGVEFLGNAVIKGNLVLTGTPADNLSLANIHVQGNLDLSGLDGDFFDIDGIIVDGDTTF